jgi:RNA polymerase-associated protein
VEKAKKMLAESIAANAEIFAFKPFYLSDEFSLLDCAIAPLLWRLPVYGIKLPAQAKSVYDYAERIFSLDSFQKSLSDTEKEMHNPE